MKVTLVPSTVTQSEVGRAAFLTSYVIDDVVAIDAGGLGLLGDLRAQACIEHVFITHSHMDHIASLPIFLDSVFQASDRCVTLHTGAATLDCLQRDVFNDRVWPDFIGLSQKGHPFVKVELLEPGRPVDVAGLRLTPVAVDHVVPTLGFVIESARAAVAIPSDTGPTESFWRAASATPELKCVFLEASFPDAMRDQALLSKHLTPTMFAAEMGKLARPVPFIAVHIKPRTYNRVVTELALQLPETRIAQPGDTYFF